MSALADYWRSRPGPERRIWAMLLLLVAGALLVAFVWLPLERSRARLGTDVPGIRASIESMQRQAAEAKRLRALPAAATTQAPLASLNAGTVTGLQVSTLDPRRVRATASDVAFNALVEWIIAAQASHGVHVESAHLERLPAPGRVKGELVLARS
jgi:type II secretory pathway component PulM